MEIDLGMAKINKYAVSESGDGVEVVERPRGGISVVMADGQGSGPSARLISRLVVGKAIALIGEGARDGAVARAVHDYLYAVRGGRVSATLAILSADLETKTIVISRNGNNAVYIFDSGTSYLLGGGADPIGVHRRMRPHIDEFPIREEFMAVVVTDGIMHAGRRRGRHFSKAQLRELVDRQWGNSSQAVADEILYQAMLLDANRPMDDMTVLVLQIRAFGGGELIRRIGVSFPFR